VTSRLDSVHAQDYVASLSLKHDDFHLISCWLLLVVNTYNMMSAPLRVLEAINTPLSDPHKGSKKLIPQHTLPRLNALNTSKLTTTHRHLTDNIPNAAIQCSSVLRESTPRPTSRDDMHNHGYLHQDLKCGVHMLAGDGVGDANTGKQSCPRISVAYLRQDYSLGVRDRLWERDHPKHARIRPDWVMKCSLTGGRCHVPEGEAGQQVPAAGRRSSEGKTLLQTGIAALVGQDEAWNTKLTGLLLAANFEASGCALVGLGRCAPSDVVGQS
jgi:hypothetical protein